MADSCSLSVCGGRIQHEDLTLEVIPLENATRLQTTASHSLASLLQLPDGKWHKLKKKKGWFVLLESQGDRDKKLASAGSLPQLQQPEMGCLRAVSQEHLPDLPDGYKDSVFPDQWQGAG